MGVRCTGFIRRVQVLCTLSGSQNATETVPRVDGANSKPLTHCCVQGVIAQTATSSAGEAPDLTSEPSSDQENTITGNVSTGAAEAAAAAATAAAIENKAIGRSLSDPTGGAAGAWTHLCNEVLNASELMSVNRIT